METSILEPSLRRAAADACRALATWLGKPGMMQIASIDQLALADATMVMQTDQPVGCGAMTMPPTLPGHLLFLFDQPSGFALADLVLQQPVGTASAWGELEQSAALESTNILCCAYLNSLVESLFGDDSRIVELVPQPPTFQEDFAESILEFALMGQAMQDDDVILFRTRFQDPGETLAWTMIWVPDAAAVSSFPMGTDPPSGSHADA